ncbi:MAG TPA: RHS repeat-associated core domain-containing protein [Bryobacteraceae bacterium]|nr:RHS repeat-associated core domain-containing protein [Bryobacteraceae bacterium]
MNRLSQATESGGSNEWSETYGYDNYGNRWVSAWAPALPPSGETPTSASWFSTNNRLSGSSYDGAGNQTSLVSFGIGYDAENRQTRTTINSVTAQYAYDGDGRRVKKVSGGVTTVYVYDGQGQLAAEYTSAGSTTPPCVTCYLTVDHLGSTRLVSDGHTTCSKRYDYRPFGEDIPVGIGDRSTNLCYGVADPTTIQFTGKERDSETVSSATKGLDYFGARYFSGAQGRFTSPDPLLNSGRPWDPQSWNRYAYALNNPLRYTDPTGLWEWAASGCASGDKDCQKAYKAHQKEFKDALSYLKQARDSYDKKSTEYKRLDAALAAYGKENVANGVTVGFGALDKGAAGRTTPSAGLASFSVMFDPAKMGGAKDFAVDVGHEGTHVDDFTQIRGGASALSDFSVEYRGYETSAFVFQGLYTPSISASSSGTVMGGVQSRTLGYGGNIIWNTSWAVNDAATLQSRDTAITKQVTEHYGHPETKPHNPWGN